jgi:hypothetical protein
MSFIRWSHNPTYTLLGVGNHIKLTIPLGCVRTEDDIIFQKVEYDSKFRDIKIDAYILRRPFLSPYVEPARHENHYVGQDLEYLGDCCHPEMRFFQKNFEALAADENKSQEPQLR